MAEEKVGSRIHEAEKENESCRNTLSHIISDHGCFVFFNINEIKNKVCKNSHKKKMSPLQLT